MSNMTMYVISNGDLFRQAFNAVVTVLGTSTFSTAVRIAVLFSIIGAVVQYMKSHDLMVLAKWYALYIAVTLLMLAPKVDLSIVDETDLGSAYNVSNVPIGIALPASMITSISHALTSSMEEAFHMPDDTQYSKTGMLFGSHVFRLSSNVSIMKKSVKNDFFYYVKNCVIGDVAINNKYSWENLSNSSNIWDTISSQASPVRGIQWHDGTFMTCKSAVPILKNEIDDDVKSRTMPILASRVFGSSSPEKAKSMLEPNIQQAYSYYYGLSQSAQSILTQNVLINSIRSGINQYAGESGASAALENLSASSSMEKMRMAWATSKSIAAYTLPLLQTVVLLMMLSLFPLIVLLTLQPEWGFKVFKNYLYSLIWVESWPILFACLNLAATFYVKHQTAGLVTSGVTLSNIDQLAQEHSDIANMAGYMMTCVPFIAIGIVKGMASAFNNAANYIGGMMHSTASSAASESVSGNISMGNMSMNNVNANKHDTNFTDMHGMSTQQLANGSLMTHTADGSMMYNTTSAMSRLATNINTSQVMSSMLSHSAEAAKSHSSQLGENYAESLAAGSSHLQSYAESQAHNMAEGSHHTIGESSTYNEDASQMNSIAHDVAKRNGVSFAMAYSGLTQFSQGASISGGKSGNIVFKAIGFDYNVSGNFSTSHSRSSTGTASHDKSVALSVSNNEASQFREAYSHLKSYGANAHADSSTSQNDSKLSQIASDLRKSEQTGTSYSNTLSESERYSELANYVNSNSGAIQNNFDTQFADYVNREVTDKQRAEILLSDTHSVALAEERSELANRFIKTELLPNVEKQYDSFKASHPVSDQFKSDEQRYSKTKSEISNGYHTESDGIGQLAHSHGAEYNVMSADLISKGSDVGQKAISFGVESEKIRQNNTHSNSLTDAKEGIREGDEKSEKMPFYVLGKESDYFTNMDKKDLK